MTIDQGSDRSRYQGVVALEGQGFEEAAHQYFRQSEQIPTQVRLAVAEQFEGGRPHLPGGRPDGPVPAVLAGAACARPISIPATSRRATLERPGRAVAEDDAWVEAKSLVATVEDHELVDPAVSSERLLYRLFHERGVRVFEGQRVHEECRCSHERIMA